MTLNSNLQADTLAKKVKAEYEKGKQFNTKLELYDKVKTCEQFYEGDQWNGLKTVSIRPVTMNFVRRVVSYFSSMIVSDDIGFELRPFYENEQTKQAADVLTDEIKRVIERQKIKTKNRESLRDASVDGDSAFYFWFDADARTGRDGTQGEIVCETIMNTNILFGNPYSHDVQKQPYILLVRRRPVSAVRAEAQKNGFQDIERIQSETESDYKGEDESADDMTTEQVRLWKQRNADGKNVVWFCKTCGEVVLQGATETGLSFYPVAYWSWMQKKNCYHGVRPMDEVINTQISVNRLWTAIRVHLENLAFPKIVYDRAKFPRGWDSTPGRAIGIEGGVTDAVSNKIDGVPLGGWITDILQLMITSTRDFMGASDAALGNIKPDNTSAILAVQKASSAPLELQRLAFFQFVEDYVRILVDMMHAYYGIREVKIPQTTYDEQTGAETTDYVLDIYDFSALPQEIARKTEEIRQASIEKCWDEYEQASGIHDPNSIPPRVFELVNGGMTPIAAHFKAQAEQAQQIAAAAQKQVTNRGVSMGSMQGAGTDGADAFLAGLLQEQGDGGQTEETRKEH